ncbi:sugar ABC transporter substrate-binding protein [Pseudolysinimonas yzui]|uniref:Ribose ABC transporter substrate-binding protein n=1 Tax=Pseudolysinimonas yzui TaxID=2708254 RepID=A0A8J3GTC7_9MICO|nr:substrate-binding domain-containing protein [Pseudolysinimonas yzui]GHF27447.1 ribose ABC transporter substrate-binding protein [Pseudolysinimonas yzui]
MIHHHMRLTAGLATAATAVVLVAGCSSPSPADPADITIAAVYQNLSDPFWQTIACGAQARADELGVDLQLFTSTDTDANAIAGNFETALLGEPDGVIATPFNNNQFVAQYTQLMADGVPVVSGNGTDPQVEYKNVYSDTDTGGLAEDVAGLIPEGAGTMVVLGGAPGIPPLEGRTVPFIEAVQEMRSDLTPLPIVYSGFDVNKATSDVAALIIANPDLKLVIAATGPDGVGAAAAIEQAGKVGEITLIAFDAVPPEVDALRSGTITALIAQDPFNIGASSVDAIVEYLEANPDGGAVEPDGSQPIKNVLLTADNVDDPDNANYLYKTSC